MSDSRPPGKRAACDRCRTQKLRCLRVQGHPTDSCIRCVRSQMECVNSSSKRPGRPRNSTNASKKQPDLPPVTTSCTDSSAPLSVVDIQALEGNVDDWFNLGLLETDYDQICSAPWSSVDSGFPMHDGGTANTLSTLSTPPDGTSTSASLNGLMTDTSLSDHFQSLQSEQGDNGLAQPFCGQPLAANVDLSLSLSVLQRDLSKQLFALKSTPLDLNKIARLTCLHDGSSDSSNTSQADLENNPLAQIATTLTDFANFLRSIQASTANDANTTAPNGSPLSSVHPQLSMADLLTILSCHMLTVSIYDSIFLHFTDQALHNPVAVSEIMQSAPKLLLGGVEIPSRLETLNHFLHCLVKSQLGPIEALLGLPDEFCVSLQRDGTGRDRQPGIFSGQNGQLLCATLIKMETEKASEGRDGLGVVESLKQNMRRVQDLA